MNNDREGGGGRWKKDRLARKGREKECAMLKIAWIFECFGKWHKSPIII